MNTWNIFEPVLIFLSPHRGLEIKEANLLPALLLHLTGAYKWSKEQICDNNSIPKLRQYTGEMGAGCYPRSTAEGSRCLRGLAGALVWPCRQLSAFLFSLWNTKLSHLSLQLEECVTFFLKEAFFNLKLRCLSRWLQFDSLIKAIFSSYVSPYYDLAPLYNLSFFLGTRP